jgi:hypothetical protein
VHSGSVLGHKISAFALSTKKEKQMSRDIVARYGLCVSGCGEFVYVRSETM